MPTIERITSLFHAPPLPANRPCLVKLAVPHRAGSESNRAQRPAPLGRQAARIASGGHFFIDSAEPWNPN
jgi:hypothetical protein